MLGIYKLELTPVVSEINMKEGKKYLNNKIHSSRFFHNFFFSQVMFSLQQICIQIAKYDTYYRRPTFQMLCKEICFPKSKLQI